MSFTHPVLADGTDVYTTGAKYECTIDHVPVAAGIQIRFDHLITNCPDLANLVQEGKAVYSLEVKAKKNSDFFKVSSSKNYKMKVLVPDWVMHSKEFSILARVIAKTEFLYRPNGLTPDLSGLNFEILPGMILAVSEYECTIYPSEGVPLMMVGESADDSVKIDFEHDPIYLQIPAGIFNKLEHIPAPIRDAAPGLIMLQLSVLVEALAQIRYNEDISQDWVGVIKELAEKKGILEEELSVDGPALISLAERIYDDPICSSISDLHKQYVLSSEE